MKKLEHKEVSLYAKALYMSGVAGAICVASFRTESLIFPEFPCDEMQHWLQPCRRVIQGEYDESDRNVVLEAYEQMNEIEQSVRDAIIRGIPKI